MIKQRKVTHKTTDATLTYAEMGDIVVSAAATITLPTPSNGLWYRVSNVSTDTMSIYYGSTLTTIGQYEQVLCLANGTSAWWFSKSGGGGGDGGGEGGVTNHGELNGLDDDDHPQYLNKSRHNALTHVGVEGVAGLIRQSFVNTDNIVVKHNMGKRPAVQVIGGDGPAYGAGKYGDDTYGGATELQVINSLSITHNSINQVTVELSVAYTGEVICIG